MNATQQQEPARHRAEKPNDHRYYPDDEIELMDYLLVIWKWKYIILAGTFGFALVAALISFMQPTMYRSNIVLKPETFKIDSGRYDNGKKVFISSVEIIKILIENDLKYKLLDDIKSSNRTNSPTTLEFLVDIHKDSNNINVSLESASVEDGTDKLNYLIKTLPTVFANKTKLVRERYEEKIELKKNKIAAFHAEIENIKRNYLDQIEQKKTLLAELKEKEVIARKEIDNTILLKKYELDELSFKEKMINTKIKKYQQELSDIDAKIKLLQDSKDISQNNEYMLTKLSIENDYRNTFQKYFELNENAKYSLFGIQKKITELSKEITNLKKTKDNIKADPFLQPNLYKIQKDIINVSKELEKLEKGKNNIPNDNNYGKRISDTQKNIAKLSKEIEQLEKKKLNIQAIQILQPPITTEISKTNKTKRNVILSSITGLFLMLFLSFFVEYISKHKRRANKTKL